MSVELKIKRYEDIGLFIPKDFSMVEPDVLDTVREIDSKFFNNAYEDREKTLLGFMKQYDQAAFSTLGEAIITKDQLQGSLDKLNKKDRQALENAHKRIADYHKITKLTDFEYTDEFGNRLGQQVTPLDRVGIYVPGGRASYPSTLLMAAIPAKIAGVADITVATPAKSLQSVSPMVLAAAELTGVDRLLLAGGAHAIFALRYGIKDKFLRADKIVGPGNKYVVAAKSLCASEGVVGIDMVAGPSEIIIYADSTATPEWVAIDLFAQAEHDPDARAILISDDKDVLDAVKKEMQKLISAQARREVIIESFAKESSFFVYLADVNDILSYIHINAPEHLQLAVKDARKVAKKIRNAGAIFIGNHTPEAFGDYCAGPNHTLPTGRSARFSSPLGAYDFQKRTSIIECSKKGAQPLAKISATLAESEGLHAHAASARLRLDS